jgi:hypothetical protein
MKNSGVKKQKDGRKKGEIECTVLLGTGEYHSPRQFFKMLLHVGLISSPEESLLVDFMNLLILRIMSGFIWNMSQYCVV